MSTEIDFVKINGELVEYIKYYTVKERQMFLYRFELLEKQIGQLQSRVAELEDLLEI